MRYILLCCVIFLPLIFVPPAEPHLGVSTWPGQVGEASRFDITRVHGVLYKDYLDETQMSRLKHDISVAGNRVHLTLFGRPDGQCGPLRENEFQGFWEYAQWILDNVSVYSVAVWNEQDARGGHPDHYGCHGDPELYMKLLAFMYPRLRSYGVEVRMGGLMLDDKEDLDFLQKLLELGLGQYTSVVPIHHYAFYGEPFGGVWTLREKLEDVMGMTNLPVVIEETNLLCESDCERGFHLAQAAYIAYAYSTAYDLGVSEVLIYCLCRQPGWKNAALYDTHGTALPSLEYLKILED